MRNYLFALLLLLATLLGGCVKTEIVPEVLESQLTLATASASLTVGSTVQVSATFTDERGQNRSSEITWESANATVATVNNSGLVTGIAPGQTTLTARAPGNLLATLLVTVVGNAANAVAQVSIAGSSDVLTPGATLQLDASVSDLNGAALPGKVVTWASSNPGVLSVNDNGLVTAVAAGTASVTATSEGVSSLPWTVQVIPESGLSRMGTFSSHGGYSVKGTATLQQVGTQITLTLGADFLASNGPQLGVYLAKTATGSLNSQNSRKLADLQSNAGLQTYSVPADVAFDEYDYVVIYCIPFNVRFGTAALE